jgi:hypothetical protein
VLSEGCLVLQSSIRLSLFCRFLDVVGNFATDFKKVDFCEYEETNSEGHGCFESWELMRLAISLRDLAAVVKASSFGEDNKAAISLIDSAALSAFHPCMLGILKIFLVFCVFELLSSTL